MATDLPDNLIRYFAAQNDHDADGMAACFAPDAQVMDEGQTYVGRSAIRDWKLDTISKYRISIRPLSVSNRTGELTVIAQVAGNFPGSPANLTSVFATDKSGLIQRLEIH